MNLKERYTKLNLKERYDNLSSNTQFNIWFTIVVIAIVSLFFYIRSHCDCEASTLEKDSIRRYEILSYRPPKHFYVDIKDVETKQVYNSVYVSKHCNAYRDIVIGSEYNLKVHHYISNRKKDKGAKSIGFYNLENDLCR